MAETEEGREEFTVVARKPYNGLPTACPISLPLYIYLKFARFPFLLEFNSTFPDSDQIPYVESGTYVAYNNENGGVINCLKKDGIVDLDAELCSDPEWVSMNALISSGLSDAILYELWLGPDQNSAWKIYYSDIPWIIAKALFVKQVYAVKQQLGITKANADRREEEIYRKAKIAYVALSTRLGQNEFLYERPSSLDAAFLGHVLFTLEALPESSVLRTALLEHNNIIRYAEKFKSEYLDTSSASPSVHQFPSEPSSSTWKSRSPYSSSQPKRKPKREKTEEEKTFKRRAKYFLVTQLVAVLLFLSVMGGYDFSEVEDDDEDLGYDD